MAAPAGWTATPRPGRSKDAAAAACRTSHDAALNTFAGFRIPAMLRTLRFVGFLIVHTVIALIGTAIVEHVIWRLVPAHSVVGILWKECILSATCAALIGFGVWKIWPNSAAKWVWVLPALWFSFHSRTVLVAPPSFFVITVPFVRAASYSTGAYISSLLIS